MDEQLRKRALRAQVLASRDGLGERERTRKSAAICKAIEAIPEYARAESILFYMPFRGEVDISPLLQNALLNGRKCALPKCDSNRQLRLFAVSDLSCDLAPGMWGLTEPKDCLCECTPGVFSVIIVPGVAFDRQGRRIGYGAGYYDRLLPDSGISAVIIAPAFALQVVGELPYEPHDRPVDVIVTEEETIDCRRAGEDYHG